MNDFAPFEPSAHGTPADGLVIRPARPDDEARVARLLALRGTSVEDAAGTAPGMIEALPVLMLGFLPVPVLGSDDAAPPSGADPAPAVLAREGAEPPVTVPSAGAAAPSGSSPAEPSEPELPEGVPDDLLTPVALSGAFVLPGDADSGRPERWTISGLVVDPAARRHGIGRAVLAAVLDAVDALAPGEEVISVVNATNHASIGLHLALGFDEVARVEEYAGITFEGGEGVVLVHAGEPGDGAGPAAEGRLSAIDS